MGRFVKCTLTLKINTVKIMKTELSKIAQDLLLGLLGVSKSVFVVCENDDYGREL